MDGSVTSREVRIQADAEKDAAIIAEKAGRYEAILDAQSELGIAAAVTGPRGIQWVNAAYTALLGYEEREVTSPDFDFWRLVPQEDRGFYARAFERRVSGHGDAYRAELRLRHKDGTIIPVEISSKAQRVGADFRAITIIRDLRPLLAATAALRLHSDVLEKMNEGVVVSSAEGRILYTNRAQDAMFGYEAGELIGKNVAEFNAYPPEENKAVVAGIIADLEADGTWTGDVHNRRKDGSTFWSHARIARLASEGEARWVCVQEDVTERKRTELELQRSRQTLQDFVDTSAIGLHWVGPDGTILWANHADHAILGYEAHEYLGQDIRKFHADPDVIEDILARLLRDERLHEYPARLRAKDGSIRQVLIDSSVLWEDGKFVHTRCFTRDVTAHRATQERLRGSEERLGRILDTAPAQILTIDAAGTILTINRSVRGADISRAVGINVYDTVVPEDRARVREIIETVFRTGEIAEYETRGILDASTVHWFQVRVGPLELDDGSLGAVIISTDIEESRHARDEIARMRAQLAQGEKLAALGSLVSGVAHELRTPLTFLSNNVFLLGNRLEDAARRNATAAEANTIAAPFLDEITAGVDRIDQLVEDLRRYTRTRQSLQAVPGRLPDMIVDAIELFRATSRRSHHLHIDLSSSRRIAGDRGSLQQLTLNLLQNAAEASPTGHVFLTLRDEADAVVLEVRDEGVGIPEDVQLRMYDPLFTTKATGTGLGLSIVKRIVDEHRATITCESKVGVGTTFRVRFPAH